LFFEKEKGIFVVTQMKGIRHRTQIGMFRPIRMDHTNCLQVAIKSIQFKGTEEKGTTEEKKRK
jgi:hypothetical protein